MMWNDEDNNPYGTNFEPEHTDDGNESADSPISYKNKGPPSPSSDDEYRSQAFTGSRPSEHDHEDSDAEEDEEYSARVRGELAPKKKKGGYDSRIEQILYENPELPILITDAGKSLESGGKYIVYTIRTGDLEVRRRYSEFASLRDALCRLHPTLIMPPIPEKHTMADYAANPTKAKQDQQIIDLRKRMLAVFLNRCRRMEEVRNDGVWWRFLDPNASWNEVLHSHPVSSIPKSNMKAPPLDPANPTPAHAFLPVPPSSAKLRTVNGSRKVSAAASQSEPGSENTGLPATPADYKTMDFAKLAEEFEKPEDLDDYFDWFEGKTEELEKALTGPVEKINRRTLTHLTALSSDLAELGARFNGFSLSEQSPSLAAAIERIGQAVDSSYIATEELSGTLGAHFAEPMRESAQFASIVRGVLRYWVLKRVQQENTNEQLAKQRTILEQLERSEMEAKRIDQYLSQSGSPRRSTSSAHDRPMGRDGNEDTASIDSDFPPTHDSSTSTPSASQGAPQSSDPYPPPDPTTHRRTASSGNFITNKIFGRISHAVHGVVDVDPERTRRDMIGKTRETISQLEQAQGASGKDVIDASKGVAKDLGRFQKEKEDDLRRYMLAYARAQIEWAKKNKETWEEAKAEVLKIEED